MAGCLSATAAAAQAQITEYFSIDYHGPTIAVPDSFFGIPITEGDLLTATPAPGPGPLPPPAMRLTGGFPGPPVQGLGLALHPPAVGHPPGVPGFVELDALSVGLDPMLSADQLILSGMLRFSVDEFAAGPPGGGGFLPSLASEAPPAVAEAAADAFANLANIQLPNPPPPPVFGAHAGVLDGDGMPSASGFAYPGLGLVEPIPAGPPPNFGDNVDALTTLEDPNAVYFSLDASFVDPHPLAGGLPNSGSALAHGFVGGDILQSLPPAGPPLVWAPANALGLDLVGGPDTDDLDALIVSENQNGVLDLPLFPDDWVLNNKDMILFSLRRGSALVTSMSIDSLRGLPIEEGDILMPPVAGGLSPFPGIYVPAEALGLATVRSGTSQPGAPAMGFADDLDAANLYSTFGSIRPLLAAGYCFCPPASSPCGNGAPLAGCANVTGAGSALWASGSSSASFDDLLLTATQLPPNQFGLVFMGPAQASVPFGNGLRCIGPGAAGLFRYPVQGTGPGGVLALGPGIRATSQALFPPAGQIAAGGTWNFQAWYRDPGGPCGTSFNFSNAVAVLFTP